MAVRDRWCCAAGRAAAHSGGMVRLAAAGELSVERYH